MGVRPRSAEAVTELRLVKLAARRPSGTLSHDPRMARARDEDMEVFRIRAGDIADAGSWVYVWLRLEGDRRVVYAGATGLAPRIRAWLHLHDPDPDIGRIAARYREAVNEELDVVAVRIPDDVSRQHARSVLIRRLAEEGLLSERYVGDAPPDDSSAFPSHATLQVERIVDHVHEHALM